jgi:chemotaxis protein methyltransferase CheR
MQHNLLDGVPARVSACQVVFCRNVLIYFSPEHTVAFLDKVAAALTPGAYLFLGAAESLWHVTDRFEPVQLGESFAYRRRSEPVRRARTAPAANRAPLKSPSRQQRLAQLQAPRRRESPVVEPVHASDSTPQIDAVAEIGRRALDAGENSAAVIAFRKWAYLAPDDPLASLHLALALEAGGHHAFAQRAFGVARAAAHRGGASIPTTELGGYSPEELVRLLESKQVRER